ncbi:hypothetical protein B0H13DRAFT_1621252 [Mycena leptocephala]|nr:hypothetical protein B0H13DRAFT_1621252 [Mycena leptocephala]
MKTEKYRVFYCVFIHCLSPDEVEYVWSVPNTLGKILLLILRYMVPIFMMVENITRSGLPVIAMSDVVCSSRGPHLSMYAGWLSIVISNFLVLLRIWTMLPHGYRLIAWSLGFFIFMQLASFSVTMWVVSNMIPVLVFEPFVGICTFTTKPSVFGLWVVGLAFEVVVFVTVIWNALDRPRALTTASNAQMRQMLFRDGVVYFLVCMPLLLRIANTVIAVVAPISQLFVIVFFIWATTTLTTSRLIINSRHQAAKAQRTRAEEFQSAPDPELAHHTDDMRRTRSGSIMGVG